jgi:hypothetical protein
MAVELQDFALFTCSRTRDIAADLPRASSHNSPQFKSDTRLPTRSDKAVLLKTVQFLAVIFTAMAVINAHLLALPDQLSVLHDTYYIVYRGWAQLGVVLIGALIADAALAVLVRDRRISFWFAVGAFVAVAATLPISLLWIYPANQWAANWSTLPDNWEALRQSTYGHTANAILAFVGLCAVTCSVVSYRE